MANDSTNTTPVEVKTIFNDKTWDNLLSGIAAIQGKNFEKIKQALNEQQRASEQQGIDEEVRSINAERNNRAVNNALFAIPGIGGALKLGSFGLRGLSKSAKLISKVNRFNKVG